MLCRLGNKHFIEQASLVNIVEQQRQKIVQYLSARFGERFVNLETMVNSVSMLLAKCHMQGRVGSWGWGGGGGGGAKPSVTAA